MISRLPQGDVHAVNALEVSIAPVEPQPGPAGRAAEADADSGYSQVQARSAVRAIRLVGVLGERRGVRSGELGNDEDCGKRRNQTDAVHGGLSVSGLEATCESVHIYEARPPRVSHDRAARIMLKYIRHSCLCSPIQSSEARR
jgi:hypothetical protein